MKEGMKEEEEEVEVMSIQARHPTQHLAHPRKFITWKP